MIAAAFIAAMALTVGTSMAGDLLVDDGIKNIKPDVTVPLPSVDLPIDGVTPTLGGKTGLVAPVVEKYPTIPGHNVKFCYRDGIVQPCLKDEMPFEYSPYRYILNPATSQYYYAPALSDAHVLPGFDYYHGLASPLVGGRYYGYAPAPVAAPAPAPVVDPKLVKPAEGASVAYE